ncbi:hypothetical protein K432DRAFT_387254 [Lepidopterella palustris CBS 459.81]|uniref:Uncharacterized protein n=1 Tax=Lepidopterella palustris CBS 459.81 TaxID=1314670 RepID=A0A8E2DXV8_9PEZI|nr:hypothetical protein K432DRAFT_387254 [Lepidopterella palustris CBS 459.81]
MRFNQQPIVVALSFSILTSAFPLDAAQQPRPNLLRRAKTYSVVNVDGGSTPSPPSVTILETVMASATPKMETIITTDVVTPSTNTATSILTVVESSTAKQPPSPTLLQTGVTSAEPSIVTIVITASESAATTEYYDDGTWHTRYPVKTFTTTAWNNGTITTSSSITSPPDATTSTSGPLLEHYVGNGVWETLYPPSTTAESTQSIPFPTLPAPSAQNFNHTQIPGRRRRAMFA